MLREGGPRERGRLADVVAALLGSLLLVLAIVLVAVLPDKEYASPQFRVTFTDALVEVPTQSHTFLEAPEAERVRDFLYDLPDDVQSIHLIAEFTDDVVASVPDQFFIELFDPEGNPVSTKYSLANEPARDATDPADPNTVGRFDAKLAQGDYVIPVVPHPSEEIVTGAPRETEGQVLQRLEERYHIPSAGTWRVHVTLVAAGDCPAPGPTESLTQVAVCRSQTNGSGTDGGNRLALNFIYTTVTPAVEQLGQSS